MAVYGSKRSLTLYQIHFYTFLSWARQHSIIACISNLLSTNLVFFNINFHSCHAHAQYQVRQSRKNEIYKKGRFSNPKDHYTKRYKRQKKGFSAAYFPFFDIDLRSIILISYFDLWQIYFRYHTVILACTVQCESIHKWRIYRCGKVWKRIEQLGKWTYIR